MGAPGADGVDRQSLHTMMTAYKTTSLLRTGIELGVFDALSAGPLGYGELAERLGLDARAARIAFDALAALRLLEVDGGLLRLGPGVGEHLVRGVPGYFGDMIHVLASDEEWEALRRLPDAVRSGGTVMDSNAETPGYRYWEDFAAHAVTIAAPTAEVVVDAIDAWARRREELDVLDVACGHGIYGFTVAQRYPQARVTALDWPNVLDTTARHADEMKVADRTTYIGGDMFEVDFAGPYDLITITNVLHHFSQERATELLDRAAAVLKPGGRVVIVGFALDDSRPPQEDPAPHLFSVLMLVWTSRGEVHTASAYGRMAAAAGLETIGMDPVPGLPFKVVVAQRS